MYEACLSSFMFMTTITNFTMTGGFHPFPEGKIPFVSEETPATWPYKYKELSQIISSNLDNQNLEVKQAHNVVILQIHAEVKRSAILTFLTYRLDRS